jgi:hypothetical protein
MTWREKTVIRILLIIAGLLAEDAALSREIQALANHVAVYKGDGGA